MSPTVLLCIIHHNDRARWDHVSEGARRLQQALKEQTVEADILAIGWQPAQLPRVAKWDRLLRAHASSSCQVRWGAYRGQRRRPRWSTISDYLRGMIHALRGMHLDCCADPAIEKVLLAKHARAWHAGLDSGASAVLVLEDDARFSKDVDAIAKALKEISERNDPSYLDLAGGLPPDQVLGGLIGADTDNGLTRLRLPATNTLCGYAINSRLAGLFATALATRSALFRLPADWCVNEIFMQLQSEGVLVDCRHAIPHLLRHGSATREVESGLRRL